MKMTLDVKTLIIGFLAGILLMLTLGVSGGNFSSFGIAAPPDGLILVKSEKSRPYIIDVKTGRAISVDSCPKLY